MFWKFSNAKIRFCGSSFSPLAEILAAYLILGEAPNMAQYIGGSIIMGGIILNQIGILRQSAKTPKVLKSTFAKEMDNLVGFKGLWLSQTTAIL